MHSSTQPHVIYKIPSILYYSHYTITISKALQIEFMLVKVGVAHYRQIE